MKEKKERQKEKKELSNNKLMEKKERLKEIDKQNDNQRKKIIKKIEIMEKKKMEIDKEKDEHLQKLREIRDSRLRETKNNRILLSKEDDEIRRDILDYENYKFEMSLGKYNKNTKKRANSQHNSISRQREEEKKLKNFMKIMNTLQGDSVIKKTDRQKRMMYNEKIKKEKEEKKKEEEKKLEELGLI